MKPEYLIGKGVRVIAPGPLYGKKAWVKAIQLGLDGKPSTVLVESREFKETEVKLTDISTDVTTRKWLPQTEMFI
jgi:hypothetical protein